jgi:hypothetical protein
MPKAHFISVDFPAPFSPMTAWTLPARTARDTPSSALTPGNCLLIFAFPEPCCFGPCYSPCFHFERNGRVPFFLAVFRAFFLFHFAPKSA